MKTTSQLSKECAEAKKAVQDSIDNIEKGQLIETYVTAGFALVVMVVVFISFF